MKTVNYPLRVKNLHPLADSQMEGASMKDDKNWFGATLKAEAGVGLMHFLLAPLFRAPAKKPRARRRKVRAPNRRFRRDACGPPAFIAATTFLLSFSLSTQRRVRAPPVRFGPFDRRIGSDSLGSKL